MIKKVYADLPEKIEAAKKATGRPLSLAEKILYSHLSGPAPKTAFKRGVDYVDFDPDRIAMQDATAQMALLQFMQAGKSRTSVPTTVHCDHLIMAAVDADKDLTQANITNKEVYDFLASVSNKYGIGFWKPGSGIIHQIVLENYAFPGGMMIGTDSHTPNAGGLGMVAIGVGGADAVDVMVGMPWELKFPKIIGIKLTGKLSGWSTPKDIILKVAGLLTVKGGTGCIVEYFGDGADSLSATGKATICNMGAEIGATCSLFGYDKNMSAFLKATGRADVASMADQIAGNLTGDPEVYADPADYFDQVIEIDLTALVPHINGPFSPDKSWKVEEMKQAVKEQGYPAAVEYGLIGSCTNSSYEDISAAASVIKQAVEKNIPLKARLLLNPGSERIRQTMVRDGYWEWFRLAGATLLSNACGPCIGQWKRENADSLGPNSIVHSFNRNFAKRADGNPNTNAFVASPAMVAAYAVSGRLDFNPLTDTLTTAEGKQVKLELPSATELPPQGFSFDDVGFQAPAEEGSHVTINIDPASERLQVLAPFDTFKKENFSGLKLLLKAKGKCTTDHISMAGPWLRYRGHLDNISGNMFIGAVNAFNDKTNSVLNVLSGAYAPVPDTARAYKAQGGGSLVVGDENYGEGSSREHAAMEPRHLGVRVVLVRSFARIHETNLKKQGVLALTFAHKGDYDKIAEGDSFDVVGVENITPGKDLLLKISHADGSQDEIPVTHTYNANQIEWFKAGSALNLIRERSK